MIRPAIDVVMPTSDSNHLWLGRVILSIFNNCPVCCLIVIDNFSQDGTIRRIRKTIPNSAKLEVMQSDAYLGPARRMGIDRVHTELFAFIDDDVELCDNWFDLVSAEMDEDVGACHGSTYIPGYFYPPKTTGVDELIKPTELSLSDIIIKGLFNVTRGETTNTIVRTDLVRDWTPPKHIHIFEDYLLTQHVLDKGSRWLRANEVRSVHHRYARHPTRFNKIERYAESVASAARVVGACSMGQLLTNLAARTGSSLTGSLRQKRPDRVVGSVKNVMAYVRGWLKWQEYVDAGQLAVLLGSRRSGRRRPD